MARELGERIGDEERVGKGGTAERSRWERSRLDDGGSHGKEMRVGVEGKRDGAKLRGDGEPSNSAVGEKKVAAGGVVGRWRKAGIGDRESRRRTESNGKVGNKGMEITEMSMDDNGITTAADLQSCDSMADRHVSLQAP